MVGKAWVTGASHLLKRSRCVACSKDNNATHKTVSRPKRPRMVRVCFAELKPIWLGRRGINEQLPPCNRRLATWVGFSRLCLRWGKLAVSCAHPGLLCPALQTDHRSAHQHAGASELSPGFWLGLPTSTCCRLSKHFRESVLLAAEKKNQAAYSGTVV